MLASAPRLASARGARAPGGGDPLTRLVDLALRLVGLGGGRRAGGDQRRLAVRVDLRVGEHRLGGLHVGQPLAIGGLQLRDLQAVGRDARLSLVVGGLVGLAV